jgi:hypothetical protein
MEERIRPKRYIDTIPKDFFEKIRATRDRIADCQSFESAEALLGMLNAFLANADLIGRDAQLISSKLYWQYAEINPDTGAYEPAHGVEQPNQSHAPGTFTGFDLAIDEDDLFTIKYRVEMPAEGEGLGYKIVTSPLEGSVLFLAPPEDGLADHVEEQIMTKLEELTSVDDKEFQTILEMFIEAFKREDNDDLSVHFLREVGIIATHMFALEVIKNNPEVQKVVLEVVELVIKKDVNYQIEGQEIIVEQLEGYKNIMVDDIECEGRIHGLGVGGDYNLVPGQGNDGFTWKKDAVQPVLVLRDDEGKEHYLPLKEITRFEAMNNTNTRAQSLCVASLTRFLSLYPDVLHAQ